MVSDLVRCYGAAGRTIVFTETKRDANELSTSLGEKVRAQALHGDIPQNQREVSLLFTELSLACPNPQGIDAGRLRVQSHPSETTQPRCQMQNVGVWRVLCEAQEIKYSRD